MKRAFILLAVHACSRREMPTSPEPAKVQAVVLSTEAQPDDQPLPLETMLLPNGHRLVLAPARGSPSFVVVALHAGGGSPEWTCETWQHMSDARALTVCPIGTVSQKGSSARYASYDFSDEGVVRAQVHEALQVAEARAQSRVVILTGCSTGAWYAGRIAAKDPKRFPRVVLMESLGRPLEGASPLRVLFACGSDACAKSARLTLAHTELDAHVEEANIGHSCERPVQLLVKRNLSWLLEPTSDSPRPG